MTSLSTAQARRIALAAQGFREPRPIKPDLGTLTRTVRRTGVLQVDSVQVLQRAHFMPLFSRMGSYDTFLLRRASEGRSRRLIEYWAHVQALMPVELWPVMQHRMESYRASRGKWFPLIDARPGVEREVLAAVRDLGPVTARDLEHQFSIGPRTKAHWGWNWSEARKVLDFLYMVGEVAVAARNEQFEVCYDLPERVLPAAVLAMATPAPAEAERELIRRAARSHGVGTARCLADYYRMRLQPGGGVHGAQSAINDLVDGGELLSVSVDGWNRPAYLHRDSATPRKVGARALLSPFDPLVWERQRTEQIFGFRYRIEIYTPAAKREFGYYVLPFLLGERLVARVDLKADRKTGTLRVQAAYAEANAPAETAAELAVELRELATWLGLERIAVRGRGDLSRPLSAQVALSP